MSTRKNTVLSDESIMKHCIQYQPIPMKKVEYILYDKAPKPESFIQTKKPKYIQPSPRPVNYNALASSVAKSTDPTGVHNIQKSIDDAYKNEVNTRIVVPIPRPIPRIPVPSGPVRPLFSSSLANIASRTLVASRTTVTNGNGNGNGSDSTSVTNASRDNQFSEIRRVEYDSGYDSGYAASAEPFSDSEEPPSGDSGYASGYEAFAPSRTESPDGGTSQSEDDREVGTGRYAQRRKEKKEEEAEVKKQGLRTVIDAFAAS